MSTSRSKVVSINHIDLRKKAISTRGVPILGYEAAFISHRIQQISHLDLGCSGIGVNAIGIFSHTLHRVNPLSLHTILLDGNALSHEAISPMLEELPRCKALRTLDLSKNRIRKCHAICTYLTASNTGIIALGVHHNPFISVPEEEARFCEALLEVEKAPTKLRGLPQLNAVGKAEIENWWGSPSLDLSRYHPAGRVKALWRRVKGEYSGADLVTTPKGDEEDRLEVPDSAGLLDYELYYLGLRLERDVSPVHLRLNHCRIGDEGCKMLVQALRVNKTVLALELRDNCIGDHCVEGIADLIELGQLKEIDLRDNPFNAERVMNRLAEEVDRLDVLNGLSCLDVECERRGSDHTLTLDGDVVKSYEVAYISNQLSLPKAATRRIIVRNSAFKEHDLDVLFRGVIRQAQKVGFEKTQCPVTAIEITGSNQLADEAGRLVRKLLDPKARVRLDELNLEFAALSVPEAKRLSRELRQSVIMEARVVCKQEVDDKGRVVDLAGLLKADIGAVEASSGLFVFSHAVVVR